MKIHSRNLLPHFTPAFMLDFVNVAHYSFLRFFLAAHGIGCYDGVPKTQKIQQLRDGCYFIRLFICRYFPQRDLVFCNRCTHYMIGRVFPGCTPTDCHTISLRFFRKKQMLLLWRISLFILTSKWLNTSYLIVKSFWNPFTFSGFWI